MSDVVRPEDWFAEAPVGGYEQRYRVLRRIHTETSEWQHLEFLELESFGRALVLDGALQTSLGEDFTYHEMLVHVPLFAHPSPRRVLVVGGGDGGTLRHVLLHAGIERAVEVEIDARVVDACSRYLPEISGGAYQDPRAELVIADGAKYMAETTERFDVILVDSTDPIGPAAALIGDEFIQAAHDVLAPGGLMAMQGGSPLTQPREWLATIGAFRRAFRVVRPYLGIVPIYPGFHWSWVSGSDELDASSFDEMTVQARLARLDEPLNVYNPSLHRAAFALPTYAQRLLDHDGPLTSAHLRAAGHPFPRVLGAD